jgi:hypothetical protein
MRRILRSKLFIFLNVIGIMAHVAQLMYYFWSGLNVETSAVNIMDKDHLWGNPDDSTKNMDVWRRTSNMTVREEREEQHSAHTIILGEEHPTSVIKLSNHGKKVRLQVLQRAMGKEQPTLDAALPHNLDRIYYINMDDRPLRRAFMEAWLSEQSIPYERVTGQKGREDTCVEGKKGRRCIGISGLAQTYLHIINNLNTSGLTLVIEDDFVVRRMRPMMASVNLLPPDWDLLRWDCWDKPLRYFEHYPFSFKINPIDRQSCQAKGVDRCWYCGGTHVALWRGGESLQKLKRIWEGLPHDDVDCLLHDHPSFITINTYCIQIGVGEFHFPWGELSDISQL